MKLSDVKKFYKVIIIGAGPSGISTALNLINYGVSDILVIEKREFPRYKCCAGYLTEKTRNTYLKLGLETNDCHYSLIKDFNIFYKHKRRLNIINRFLYTNEKIDRVELDDKFFRLAQKSGINILENTCISLHDCGENKLQLSNGLTVNYKYLVFADGTTGFGSRYQKCKKCNIAMQMIFESDRPESIDIHFGITKRGYAWVSSYKGTTNVGLTDVFVKKRDYKKIFTDFLKSQNFNVNANKITSALTPIGTRTPVIHSNILFVGDAVGACDPLTLSGLRYALVTGERCAKALADEKINTYKKYIKKLKIKFGFMKVMLKVFYLKSVLFLTFNITCKCFGRFVSRIFNNFFVNKK